MTLLWRLVLTYVCLTLGGLLLLGGGGVWLFSVYTAQQNTQQLEDQATIYATYVGEVAGAPDVLAAVAPSLVAGTVLPQGVQARIFARNGAMLAGDRALGAFPSRPALAFVRNALPLPASQVEGRRYAARPVGGAADPIGIVELSQSTESEALLRRNLVQTLVPVALGAALAMALVSVLVARSIARPVGDLQRLAETLAAGQLDQRSIQLFKRSARRDEIGKLALSLDHMADQLQGRIDQIDSERRKLAAVLEGISEGVIALDSAGAILFANPAAVQLVEQTGKQETINGLLEQLQAWEIPLQPPRTVEQEVSIGPRTLLVSSSPIESSQRATPTTIIVLRDMTRLKALEQSRVRFVRSISHELRTPLTAIRGLVENLQDDARSDQQESLTTLDQETARLGRLVAELLRPSPDGDLLPLERRPVDLGQLVRELVALQQGRARRAGVTLSAEVHEKLPSVRADRDRLKQALLNLLDNGLRATPAGGTVQVVVKAAGAGVQLLVDDSGPGVPPELRERIWERGVTGSTLGLEETGGAGLGLALVREIVRGYGGHAAVEDSPLGGARFMIELPG